MGVGEDEGTEMIAPAGEGLLLRVPLESAVDDDEMAQVLWIGGALEEVRERCEVRFVLEEDDVAVVVGDELLSMLKLTAAAAEAVQLSGRSALAVPGHLAVVANTGLVKDRRLERVDIVGQVLAHHEEVGASPFTPVGARGAD